MVEQKDFYIKDGELICYLGDAVEIIIPSGVKRIKNGAFIENKNLRSVTLPKTLSRIGQSAFSKCASLKSITIPASVTFIDKCALWFSSYAVCCQSRTKGCYISLLFQEVRQSEKVRICR